MGTAFVPEVATSWGRILRNPQRLARPRYRDELPRLLAGAPADAGVLACGLRRSYGDTPLNAAGRMLEMTQLDRIISLDTERRILVAEAGLSLNDLLRVLVPRGLFTATTPGTRFVTLGGAVANDVHGKNHHSAGSFGCSVRRIGLRRTDGSTHDLGPGDPLFAATIGGLGLTGIIEWVELDLAAIGSAFLDNENIAFEGLDQFFELSATSAGTHEHTVAWIDVSRPGVPGVFSRANWRQDGRFEPHPARPRLRMPIETPIRPFTPLTLRSFNAAYRWLQTRKPGVAPVHYGPVFHPLDGIADWNLGYGRQGFWQHQSVIPPREARAAVQAMLDRITRSGEGSCLAVLKTFGTRRSPGLLSFPMEGSTLAVDFPAGRDTTLRLMEDLDAIVREAGGRLYAAKDGRMAPAAFRVGYPALDAFREFMDPGLSSDFKRRVLEQVE